MSKISELSDGGSLQSTDYLIAVRSGGNVKVQADGNLSLGALTLTGLTVDTNTLHVDATNNRVGIGTTSPEDPLHVAGDIRTDNAAYIVQETSTGGAVRMLGINAGNTAYVGPIDSGPTDAIFNASSTSNTSAFYTAGTERMRIDSSGNLLVGKTSAGFANTGHELRGGGSYAAFTRDDGTPVLLNRKTSDGTIAEFMKDGSTVGSIGSNGGTNLYLTSGNRGLRFNDNDFSPITSANAYSDNTTDLGRTAARFDDIYATNAIIQTSDANEKQDIAELDEAERRVAVAAKSLLRKFRWKDSVAEKGDEARIHFGIIAQDLQAAFEAEGLDAGRYAMFIHSTWTDEETGEERSRMGVRYSELLAFIIAAL